MSPLRHAGVQARTRRDLIYPWTETLREAVEQDFTLVII